MPPVHGEKHYTIRDYQSWDDGERWELIDGVAFNMSPAPGFLHQELVTKLCSRLDQFLEGKPCRVIVSLVDVYFEDTSGGDTVVQPDIVVICDKNKIRQNGIIGAPDLVVEVLSPSTAGRDLVQKAELYRREGVFEYWIVSPEEKEFYQNTLKDGRYELTIIRDGSLISSKFPDFSLDLKTFFAALANPPE